MRQLPEADYLRIKALFKRLVILAGGCELAASFTRVEKTSLSDYARSARMDLFPPADVILDLETQIGEPLVSREMRRLVGETNLQPKPIAEERIPHEGAKVTIHNGQFMEKALQALEDGRVDDDELRELIEIAERKMREAIGLHDKLCHLEQARRACTRIDRGRAAE